MSWATELFVFFWGGGYRISISVGYLIPIQFLYKKYFYFKQFSSAQVHNFIVKTFYFKQFSLVKQF